MQTKEKKDLKDKINTLNQLINSRSSILPPRPPSLIQERSPITNSRTFSKKCSTIKKNNMRLK
jgi:hypothetical protein